VVLAFSASSIPKVEQDLLSAAGPVKVDNTRPTPIFCRPVGTNDPLNEACKKQRTSIMEGYYSIQRLLGLRKLTRAIADHLRAEIKSYVLTFAPQLRPRTVLGDYVQSSVKGEVKGADQAFQELQGLYESVAGSKIYNLPKKLSVPIEIISPVITVTPLEYLYQAKSSGNPKKITVTSPLKWVLSYAGFPPARLLEMLSSRDRDAGELQAFVLHYIVTHVVISRQPGLAKILDALRFPVVTERLPEYGELPITCAKSSVPTVLPPDDVIVESTEISGRDVFEEVVKPEDIPKLRDASKEKLIELVKSHGEHFLGEAATD
jgi:hypothetical protein